MNSERRKFFRPSEISEMFNISVGTLANWRSQRSGCKYYRFRSRIYYNIDEFEQLIKSNPILTKESLNE
jgi:hypothetical protein